MILYESVSQPLNFLLIFLIGICSGLIFDLSRYLTFLCNKNGVMEKIFDFVSVILCGTVFFFTCLTINFGEFRFYLFLGYVLGILLERFTFGIFIAKIASACYNKLREILNRIFKKRTKEEKGESN